MSTKGSAPTSAEPDASVQSEAPKAVVNSQAVSPSDSRVIAQPALDVTVDLSANRSAEPKASDNAPAQVMQQDVARSPEQWAAELFPRGETGRVHRDRWKHSAAHALHGWELHEHHEGKPIQLTRADYDAAIAAACAPEPKPHAAALTKHLRFEAKGA